MNAAERPWLNLPRIDLLERPTPLLAADRFSEWLGIEVWIKRDDYAPLGLAGNKIRKLEYVLAEVDGSEVRTLVTVGAAQSNAARSAAVASARLGFDCSLVLLGDEPPDDGRTGNLLIDALAGAELNYSGASDWAGLRAAADEVVARLEREGRRPRFLPLGYSTPLGSVGFVAGYAELHEQCSAAGIDATAVVHASTSGGTHAGLALGSALLGGATRVIGVDAAQVYGDETEATIKELIGATGDLLGVGRPADVPSELRFEFLGPAYAEPTDESVAALRTLAALEGVLVDPVYSSKALAGLISMARAGEVEGPIVFWHTGGVPAVFAPRYQRPLA